jgi:hypothetical protein
VSGCISFHIHKYLYEINSIYRSGFNVHGSIFACFYLPIIGKTFSKNHCGVLTCRKHVFITNANASRLNLCRDFIAKRVPFGVCKLVIAFNGYFAAEGQGFFCCGLYGGGVCFFA